MNEKIPKIIHYCWFGPNQKSQLVLKCLESWKKYLPDYEIREWNDNDLKGCTNNYVHEAYENKKWAFISDYFRLYALYNYGGIYFDSDNEVFKPFDEFLDLDFFTGYENWYGQISPFTAVLGAKPKNKIIKDLLKEYDEMSFARDGQLNLQTNTYTVTLYFNDKYSLLPPYDGLQKFELEKNHIIFPYNYFCNYEENISYAVHHFNASWAPWLQPAKRIFCVKNFIFYKYKNLNEKITNIKLPNDEKIIIKIKRGKNKYFILARK